MSCALARPYITIPIILLLVALQGCAHTSLASARDIGRAGDGLPGPEIVVTQGLNPSLPAEAWGDVADPKTLGDLRDLILALSGEGGPGDDRGCDLEAIRVQGETYDRFAYGCGRCPEDGTCKLVTVTDRSKGETRTYCACAGEGETPVPPPRCHLELMQAGGKAEPRCVGECPDGKTCTLGTATLRMRSASITFYYCHCE
ncbi:MAG: hypothetical protein HY722_04490 [Planctomycetes bacterium]|nr:hypothetical protein [Planctomycetota bacterium]